MRNIEQEAWAQRHTNYYTGQNLEDAQAAQNRSAILLCLAHRQDSARAWGLSGSDLAYRPIMERLDAEKKAS